MTEGVRGIQKIMKWMLRIGVVGSILVRSSHINLKGMISGALNYKTPHAVFAAPQIGRNCSCLWPG